jgi:hypothetical protein
LLSGICCGLQRRLLLWRRRGWEVVGDRSWNELGKFSGWMCGGSIAGIFAIALRIRFFTLLYRAARLYRLAADQGRAEAQYNLGVMHANGQGVAQDDAEAVRLYRLAADQDLQPLRSAWASCMTTVEVLRRMMQRLCYCTALQRIRDMQKLSTTWASCMTTVEMLRRTMQRLCDCTALQRIRGMTLPLKH